MLATLGSVILLHCGLKKPKAASNLLLLTLSMTTVILRIVSRRIKGVKLAADDYLIFLAQVSYTIKTSAPTAH